MSTQPSIAAQVLEAWGASVQELPTSTKEECDLIAGFDGTRVIVEEKLKFDDPAAAAKRGAVLATGKVHASTHPFTPNNRLSGIVGKAASQLSSTGSGLAHDFRVLWFTAVGLDAEAKHHQLMATLYGSTRIFQLHDRHLRTCYFFRNSEFFRHRDVLDGAVVGYLHGNAVTVKLCLNPLSERWAALRDSPFAKNFKLGLIDPVADDLAGDALIMDGDVARKDEGAVMAFLEKKYGLERAMKMDMGMTSAVVRVPGDER